MLNEVKQQCIVLTDAGDAVDLNVRRPGDGVAGSEWRLDTDAQNGRRRPSISTRSEIIDASL